ncbi:MAG: hypothetical protein P8178_12505 [Candidatus Thiodiazotropha sp.]
MFVGISFGTSMGLESRLDANLTHRQSPPKTSVILRTPLPVSGITAMTINPNASSGNAMIGNTLYLASFQEYSIKIVR